MDMTTMPTTMKEPVFYTPSFDAIAPLSEDAMAALHKPVEPGSPTEQPFNDEPDSSKPVLRVRMPTVADHIGHGIGTKHFAVPDPDDARATQRRQILEELHTWLTGRVASSARLASHSDMTNDEIRAAMEEGRGWPGGRLWLLLQTMDADEIPLPGMPADTFDRLRLAGEWAAAVCENWLRFGETPVWAAEQLALGFVTEERLSDGRTIAELWPQPADLDALRDAPPLPDTDGETNTTTESMLRMTVRWNKSITDTVTVATTICLPAWAWVALALTVVFYFWVVAFLLGGQARLLRSG